MSVEEPRTAAKTELTMLRRALSASPLGIAAIVIGVLLALVFFVQFENMIDTVIDDDLAVAVRALEITVVSLWIAVSLWGWYLVRDGLERVEMKRRVMEQAEVLARIQDVVEEREAKRAKKQELDRKSRSFWSWRREGD